MAKKAAKTDDKTLAVEEERATVKKTASKTSKTAAKKLTDQPAKATKKATKMETTATSKAVETAAKPVEQPETTEKPKATTTEAEATEKTETTEEKFAKSGKRSKKVIEEEQAETERKERAKTHKKLAEEEVKKGPKPVTKPRIERRSKKYQAAAKLVDQNKHYDLKSALDLATKTTTTKFDASVEVHVRLNVDPRQADQNIRSTVSLPSGTGKTIKVAVFAPDDQAKIARAAGADLAGDEDLLQMLEKEALNFDVLISTPAYMPKLGKYARLLGPKGLMPNPKAGTVTADIKKAVTEAKSGKIEYRVDKQAIIHVAIGKVSFGTEKLLVNAEAFLNSLKSQKPASIKSVFIKSVHLTTTMGPSVKVENVYN